MIVAWMKSLEATESESAVARIIIISWAATEANIEFGTVQQLQAFLGRG